MTKDQLRALAASAVASHPVTVLAPVTEEDAARARRDRRRAENEAARDRRPSVRLVYDHCGREHAMNEEGEWLY